MATNAPVSLIVVNHNGGQRLQALLESLERSTYRRFEVIVVENGSTDNSQRILEGFGDTVSWLSVVRLENNEPLIRATNKGLGAASNEIVGLIHNDVIVSPTWLEECMNIISRSDRIGAVQGKTFNYDSRTILDGCGCVMDRHGCEHERGQGEPDDGRFDTECQIFCASGVASIFRKTAIAEAGSFDENYETGLDDVDLCWRMRLAGYDIIYAPKAVAQHIRGRTWKSSKTLSRKLVLEFAKTRMYVPYKNFEPMWFFANLPILLLHFAGGVLINLRRPQNASAYLEALVWFFGNLPLAESERLRVRQRVRRIPDRMLFENAEPGCNLVNYFIAPRIAAILKRVKS